MKKNLSKVLALLLVLVMVLSNAATVFGADIRTLRGFGTVTEKGEKGGEIDQLKPGDAAVMPVEKPVTDEPEEKPLDPEVNPDPEEPALPDDPIVPLIPDLNLPEQSFDGVVNGVNVHVDAPEGAFLEGTEMEVSLVEDLTAVQAAVDSAANVEGKVVTAVDITFKHEGEELQPNVPVKVALAGEAISAVENPKVVHIGEEAEPVEAGDEGEDGGIVFEANSFSVYAIVGDGTPSDPELPYRTTYEFYNADGTPYEFKDMAGITRTTQILKDGEVLEDVGIPTKGASQNAKFVGWYVWNEDDSLGDKVEVGEAKSVTSNTTIRLKAKLQGIVNVFFVTAVMKDDQGQDMARSIITVKQVEFTVGQSEAITVDVSDVTAEAPTSEQAVVGWNRNETAANAGTAEGTEGVITLYADGNVQPITDVMLFPAIQDAYWLYFDENDGGTGGGASYTPPVFVTVGGTPQRPADPHRAGYEFGGWYKDAACTQEFDFNQPLTGHTTVYAKWIGSTTSYTIIVKVQSTTDSAKITSANNLSHDAKSYDFWKSYTISNVRTGGTATVANTYKQLANQIDSTGYITYETCDADKTIAADGSTVLYVYYQRQVMTIHWRNSESGSDRYTWYGLYGASFADSGKTWIEPDYGYRWRTSTVLLTFMDAFKNFNPAGTSLVIYRTAAEDSSTDIYFYTENLDGSWKLDQQFDFSGNGQSTFTFSEKYDAFSLSQYSRNNSTWYDASVGSSVTKGNPARNVYVRYTRNTYDIEYHNGTLGAEGTLVRTDHVKYDAPLADHTNPTVSYPIAADADHYEFIGWFADSGWKTMVTFTELDEQTKTNYRNWYGVAEFVTISKMPSHNFPLYAGYALKGWDCALDPNGGEFTSPTQAGVFWLQYGETFSSDLKTNIKREGYVFQGWMIADVPKDSEGNLDIDVVTRDGLRFVGDDSNWTMTDDPWQFETGITGPTALIAKWFYKSSMSVVYDAGEGTNPPVDEGAYSDGATTVAFRAPVAPENKFFIGWDIQGTDTVEKLQPGATFEVSSDYAVDGVVTLVALYNETGSEEEVPVTHIDWYANNKETGEYVVGEDGEGNEIKETQPLHVSDVPLQLNEDVQIRPENTFSNSGYAFIGWAKLHKDGDTLKDHNNNAVQKAAANVPMDYALTEDNLYLKYEDGKFKVMFEGEWTETSKVAADEKLPYDDLYAVWELKYFYVYHSSDNTVEKVGMEGENWDKKNDTYNITAKLAAGYLYGGYYNAYAGASEGIDDAVKAASEFPYTDTEGTPYNPVDGISDKEIWASSDANTKDGLGTGLAMKPVRDAIYYLKEVPTNYLKPYTHYTYYKANNKIANLLMLSAIDDLNYQETGFVIIDQNKQATIAKSLTVKNQVGGLSVKLTPKKQFSVEGGYLTYLDVTSLLSNNEAVVEYWVTPDNLIVTGTVLRTFTDIDSTSIKKTDTTQQSVIKVFE